MKSDEQLIACYRDSGDGDALEELVRRHIRRIRTVIGQMIVDQASADDLTQEVFMRAFRSLATFNGQARFTTWLYRIAMNTTYSFLDRQNRSPVDYRAELPEAVCTRNPAPEDVAVQTELQSAIDLALGSLSPQLRAAIVLTSLQQMDIKEVAKIEGCTAATIYWRIHQGRKQLKRLLRDYLQS